MIEIYKDGSTYLLIWKDRGWGICGDGSTTLESKESWWYASLAGPNYRPDNLLGAVDTEAEVVPWIKMQELLND